MDPNANLAEQIRLAYDILNAECGDSEEPTPSRRRKETLHNADRLGSLSLPRTNGCAAEALSRSAGSSPHRRARMV